MSEVKLNLISARIIMSGTVHGSVVDSCFAALSAEPETISELCSALERYIRPIDGAFPFACFRPRSEVDPEPWDAGLVIIDLASRIIAADSTYSQPLFESNVFYHDGEKGTDVAIPYRLPADWLIVNSVEAYRWSNERRRARRKANPPLDSRAVLYGRPLLEFIANSKLAGDATIAELANGDEAAAERLHKEIASVHADWLLTPRDDLRGKSPREVLLEKQDFIDFDLHTRCLQWTFLNEGPPCLSTDSIAYRFAGFGTHEWVVYYDLVRHLLGRAIDLDCGDLEEAVNKLEVIKTDWLEKGDGEYERQSPAIIIENERKRLPEAMSPKDLIIDEDCDWCRASALDAEMGFGPGFWHLDGSHMDDEFAFSHYLTLQEWEAENRRREEYRREFDRKWKDREERIARGEAVEDEFEFDWMKPDGAEDDPTSLSEDAPPDLIQ
jgi:hypothetical protein